MATLPSPAELAQLQAWLADARNALHKLMTGNKPVEVATQGDIIKFGRADADQLRAYIAELEARIAGESVTGAIGFSWGL